MTTFLLTWAEHTGAIVVQAAPWLLGGFLLAGIVSVLVPVEQVTRHLGQPGLSGVLKAALVGIPLPLCSCSVIPLASSMRRQGAGRGAVASFLISTPETGVDSIAVSYALLGPALAVLRPLAAFVTAITAGALIGLSDRKVRAPRASAEAVPAGSDGNCGESCGCPDGGQPGRSRIRRAFHYGLVEMIADLSPWLVLGMVLAGLASAAIPAGFLERHVGTGMPAMLLMLVVGLPLYVCATSSTPMAAVLIAQGLSPGAALVFLLAGPATNLATMVVVSRDLGKQGLAIYLATIAVVAVGFGLTIDALLPAMPVSAVRTIACATCEPTPMGWTAAAVLILLTINGLRLRTRSRRTAGS